MVYPKCNVNTKFMKLHYGISSQRLIAIQEIMELVALQRLIITILYINTARY